MRPKEVRLSDVFHISGPLFIVSGAVGGPEATPRSRFTKMVLPLQQAASHASPFAPALLKLAFSDIEYVGLGLIRYVSTDNHRAHFPITTWPRW
jgi:hypothetical protein